MKSKKAKKSSKSAISINNLILQRLFNWKNLFLMNSTHKTRNLLRFHCIQLIFFHSQSWSRENRYTRHYEYVLSHISFKSCFCYLCCCCCCSCCFCCNDLLHQSIPNQFTSRKIRMAKSSDSAELFLILFSCVCVFVDLLEKYIIHKWQLGICMHALFCRFNDSQEIVFLVHSSQQ